MKKYTLTSNIKNKTHGEKEKPDYSLYFMLSHLIEDKYKKRNE